MGRGPLLEFWLCVLHPAPGGPSLQHVRVSLAMAPVWLGAQAVGLQWPWRCLPVLLAPADCCPSNPDFSVSSEADAPAQSKGLSACVGKLL